MKIAGYEMVSRPFHGQPVWLVKDEAGNYIGSVDIHASTNGGGFARGYGSFMVTAKGPAFFQEEDRLYSSGSKMQSHEVSWKAQAAVEAYHAKYSSPEDQEI